MASVRQSSIVWRTMGWSIGTSIGPPGSVSGHASIWGKASTSRSVARIRNSGAGTFLPPRDRSRRSERWTFQRHRVSKSGAPRIAWTRTSRADAGWRNSKTSWSSKLCWGPSDRMIASSFAAAWSSKPNPTQKRLRRARPHARLMREPKGAWTTSCMPPLSSKKRSRITRRGVGTAPSAWRPASAYSAICAAPASGRAEPHDSARNAAAASSRSAHSSRSRPISAESSRVRPGASPSQNGREGGAPFASATRTMPGSTRSTRQDALPSWNTSPPLDSTAQSSLTVPTSVPSGSRRTW